MDQILDAVAHYLREPLIFVGAILGLGFTFWAQKAGWIPAQSHAGQERSIRELKAANEALTLANTRLSVELAEERIKRQALEEQMQALAKEVEEIRLWKDQFFREAMESRRTS